MHVYFSGSISGGRNDLALYGRIVDALRARGMTVQAGEVTTASVGAAGETLDAPAIFERDLRWLEEVAARGGALVAEVTQPSHGVGYEIAAARYRFGIPVVALFRPASGRRCSAMIAGDSGISLIEYAETAIDDAADQVVRALNVGSTGGAGHG